MTRPILVTFMEEMPWSRALTPCMLAFLRFMPCASVTSSAFRFWTCSRSMFFCFSRPATILATCRSTFRRAFSRFFRSALLAGFSNRFLAYSRRRVEAASSTRYAS